MPRSVVSAKTAPQTPDPELVVLPSRLTLWTEMLKDGESHEAVLEIMETLLKRVMDGCFQVDVRQQMIPYTTNWMKNRLVQFIEQHFLCSDEGDSPGEVPPEDSEPPTAEPDAWAKGCVPLVTPSPPLRPITPKEVEVVQQETEPEVRWKRRTTPRPTVSQKLPPRQTSPKRAVASTNKFCSSFPPPKTEKKYKKVLLHAKPNERLPPLSHSTEKKISITEKTEDENLSLIVNTKKSAPLNLPNKHKAIQKLDPASLPDHCVFPKYEIVDPNAKTQKKRANRPPHKPTKQEPEWPEKSQRTETDVTPKYGTVSSFGPLRLEAMTLAKGVTFAQCRDLNLPMAPPQTPPVKLRPIRTEPELSKFSVDQFFVADPQVKLLPLT